MRAFKKLFLLTCIFSLAFLVSCSKAKDKPMAAAEQGRAAPPDFKLSDLYGRQYTLSDYKDRQPVLLFFWNTRCDFCKTELVVLNRLYPRLKEEGIEVLTIDIGEPALRVSRFLAALGVELPALLDSSFATASDYGIMGIPTFVLVNKNGEAVFMDNYFPVRSYKELLSD